MYFGPYNCMEYFQFCCSLVVYSGRQKKNTPDPYSQLTPKLSVHLTHFFLKYGIGATIPTCQESQCLSNLQSSRRWHIKDIGHVCKRIYQKTFVGPAFVKRLEGIEVWE